MSDTENLPATQNGNVPSATALLAHLGLTVVKQVTRTVLQQREDVPFCVTFEAPAKESQIQTEGRGGKPKMAPARTADVYNIASGSHQILIMNTVLEGELERAYPTTDKEGKELPGYPMVGYVGKTFLIRSHFPEDKNAASGRKNYKVYEIIEVALTGDEDKPVEGVGVVADGTEPVDRKGKPKI